jgi:predicted nucleic acid-binding Zn ribbon protein
MLASRGGAGVSWNSMNRSAPRPVRDLLLTAVPQLEDRLLVERLRRTWSALVGAEVAGRARPQSLTNGCLHVVVDNSPWLHELTLRGPELTTRLHAEVPAIRSLRFSLGGTPVDEDAPRPARPAPRGRLTEDDTRAIDAAAAAITDPALAHSARRLLARAWGAAPRGQDR